MRGPPPSPTEPAAGTASRSSPADRAPGRSAGPPRHAPVTHHSGPLLRPAHHPARDNVVARTGQGATITVKSTLLTRGVLVTAASLLAVTVSACGSDDTPDSSASSNTGAGSRQGPSEAAETSAMPTSDEPFGAGC